MSATHVILRACMARVAGFLKYIVTSELSRVEIEMQIFTRKLSDDFSRVCFGKFF